MVNSGMIELSYQFQTMMIPVVLIRCVGHDLANHWTAKQLLDQRKFYNYFEVWTVPPTLPLPKIF